MAYEFKFPDVGEGITEGELLSWKVKEGDQVGALEIPVDQIRLGVAAASAPAQ